MPSLGPVSSGGEGSLGLWHIADFMVGLKAKDGDAGVTVQVFCRYSLVCTSGTACDGTLILGQLPDFVVLGHYNMRRPCTIIVGGLSCAL